MFLGIDCSTQSLKIIVLDENKRKEIEISVIYDTELAHYNIKDGVIRHNDNGIDHVSTPTLLFIEALELALSKLKRKYDLSKIKAISGSAQQHGSVWWKCGSIDTLRKTNDMDSDFSDLSLTKLLKNSFSIDLSPIWMDNSTTVEVMEISQKIDPQDLANITGSRAYERFTGPQIKHIFKHKPNIYENTARISLISSFLASLFIGDYAPIDFSDGSGMNLLNIFSKTWEESLVNIIAPNLKEKLGEPVSSSTLIGKISKYWSKKYGFSQNCSIFAFSGDNPCSLVGLDLKEPGDICISLGTSDVLFAVTKNPKPNAQEGSILVHPEDSNTSFMMMLVYKNGDLTRKHFRNLLKENDNDWSFFNDCVRKTPVGNEGVISFYYTETEITPNISRPGILKFDQNDELTSQKDINENDCRGLLESKALSYKYHAQLLGLDKINSIVATGGASINKEILQIIADVFEMEVSPSQITNTAAIGAAIRAYNSYQKHFKLHEPNNESLSNSKETIKPQPKNFVTYRNMFKRFINLEKKAVDIMNY